ncbi:MAG TPA: Rad52/Rad22 family DNA repair protein [Acidimicrobiia bacterium]
MRQLYELARPFPEQLISKKPGGKFQADYVNHAVVTARLLEIVGPYQWEIARVITNADGVAVGCIGRLTVTVDGTVSTIEEVGDVERVGDNSASNLKSASSDAFKRAAMRLGLGLHLWAGDGYFLDRALSKRIDDGN